MAEVIAFPAQKNDYEQNYLQATGSEDYCALVLSVPEVFQPPTAEAFCINANQLLGMGSVREQARHEARRILDHNRQNLNDGNFAEVPLDVDALGTAAKVARIGAQHSQESELYKEARKGLVRDCSRKWAEAFRKNSWEYFGETIQRHDTQTDKLVADGLPVDDMIVNGLSPIAESEEADRRVNDYVRLMTHKALVKRPDAHDLATIHVSTCTDWAIRAYEAQPNGAHGGYAPEIEKLMIDYDWFDPSAGQVHHEQIGVSGTHITKEVIHDVYVAIGLVSNEQKPDKTQIHDTVGVLPRGVMASAVEFLEILDTVAGEKSGKNIYLGEVMEPGFKKQYAQICKEAELRKLEQEVLSEELACYIEDLHAQSVDAALATVMVEKYIQERLLKVAADDPEQAEIIFNKETAEGFRKVQTLQSQGLFEQANALRSKVELAAPPASSCGAGSCGLEAVDLTTNEGSDLYTRLNAKPGDKIVRDTVRPCGDCGELTVVYAFNETKVNKLCTNKKCNAYESKVTRGKK